MDDAVYMWDHAVRFVGDHLSVLDLRFREPPKAGRTGPLRRMIKQVLPLPKKQDPAPRPATQAECDKAVRTIRAVDPATISPWTFELPASIGDRLGPKSASWNDRVQKLSRQHFDPQVEKPMNPQGTETSAAITVPEALVVVALSVAAFAGAYALWRWLKTAPPPTIQDAIERGKAPPEALPSDDWLLVEQLGETHPDASSLLPPTTSDRSRWTLLSLANDGLVTERHRGVLEALQGRRADQISAVEPKPGDGFDEGLMVDVLGRVPNGEDARWCVRHVEQVGYVVRGRVLLPALVSVQSIDGVVLSSVDSPITALLLRHADDVLGASLDEWQVDLGFLEDRLLRVPEVKEADLQAWCVQFADALRGRYQTSGDDLRPEWLVEEIGRPGEKFDPARMVCADVDVQGPAEVTELAVRDGVQQRGLGAPGQPALLPAVVRVRPV